jgi:tRNA threonylcarbamoyladenosine biosynthesis protein TsaB
VLILALDTTTRVGSAALLRDGLVVQERSGDPDARHTQWLPAALQPLLAAAGVAVRDVELFAVAAGPGSFTGLRVGIATVQGLAMAHGRRIVPVSVLEALAHAAADAATPVGAWMDAQRGQVFAALYEPGRRAEIVPASAMTPGETLTRWQPLTDLRRVTFVGDGARRYRDVLAAHIGGPPTIVEAPPLAGIVGRIAAREPGRAVLPHAVVPLYVRRSDVELARERRQAER